MLNHIDTIRLNSAAEDFTITKPKTLIEAEALHLAAVALQTEVYDEIAPNAYDITIKNLRDLHTALVTWPSHASRASASDLLVQRAEGKVSDEWDWFAATMFESLRAPFDKAAAAYVGGDEKSLPALMTLATARDILTRVHKATLRTPLLEANTRIIDPVSARHALYVMPIATRDLERFGSDWFKAVRAMDGVTIKWLTPADQVAMDAVLPQEMRTREGMKV
jgi:hypothetical protein